MQKEFHPLQAQEIAKAFADKGVDYLFIGKSGAILLGYPGSTQDVDVFPARSRENGRRIVAALREIGFELQDTLDREITEGKDFVQIKSGPFDVDLIFAPDGISNFEEARGNFPRGESAGYNRQQARERTSERFSGSVADGKFSTGVREATCSTASFGFRRRRRKIQAQLIH